MKINKTQSIESLLALQDTFSTLFYDKNNMSLKESLDKGTEMSSKVIQQIGARI